MKKMMKKTTQLHAYRIRSKFLAVAVAFAIFFSLHSRCYAEYQVTLSSISPAVTDISSQFTDRPPRSVPFLLQGKIGQSYSAVFSVTDQPAITVGVGIDISSLQYDSSAKTVSLNFSFVKAFVAKPGAKPLAENAFLIVFDPGRAKLFDGREPGTGDPGNPGAPIPPTVAPPPTIAAPPTLVPPTRPPPGRTPGVRTSAADETECYGPGNKKDRDGSKQPPGGSAEDPGPPREGRGTYMSTDILNWCVIPPSAGNGRFGFRLSGPSGDKGFFKMFIPPALVALLAEQQGKSTFIADDLAIFNDGIQSSTSVTADSSGGALVNINVTFDSDSTVLGNRAAATFGRHATNEVRAASTSTDKTLTLEEQELLSLAPKTFTVSGNKVGLYGFVTNESQLAGQKVSIFRVSKTKSASIKGKVRVRTTLLGKATISSTGSYSANLKTANVFKNGSKATLSASLTSGTVRNSREVTLKNSARNLRN